MKEAFAIIFKHNHKNIFHMVRFPKGMLLGFDFPLNFLKSLLAKPYVSCFLFLAWAYPGLLKRTFLVFLSLSLFDALIFENTISVPQLVFVY